MIAIAPLVKSILGKDDISSCGLSELQSLARQFPYFAPIHLLLAEKIKSLDKDLYEQQLEKVSLYIHQPLWLHFLLNQGTFEIEVLEKETEINTEYTPVVSASKDESDDLASRESGENILNEVDVEEEAVSIALQNEPVDAEPILEPVIEKSENSEENTSLIEENELVQDDFTKEEVTDQELANIIQNEPGEIVEENSDNGNLIQDVVTPDLNSAISEENKEPDHFVIAAGNTEFVVDEDEELSGDESGLPPLHIPSLKIESLKETGNDLLFEPYHTVDYFASQGIKNPVEGISKDRFSHQLKSFTEWLKTMKRLPDDVKENQLDAGSEEKVQTLANHSIAENEVLTETMAEVWLKQGELQKAAEVYHKLSLQNPSKSHYFAAKIKSLNTQ